MTSRGGPKLGGRVQLARRTWGYTEDRIGDRIGLIGSLIRSREKPGLWVLQVEVSSATHSASFLQPHEFLVGLEGLLSDHGFGLLGAVIPPRRSGFWENLNPGLSATG